MKIYKLWCFIDDDNPQERSPEYLFYNIEIFSESGFRKRFWQAIVDEQIDYDTLDHYGLGDITSNDLCDVDTDTMKWIFEREGYNVAIETIEIDDLDIKKDGK